MTDDVKKLARLVSLEHWVLLRPRSRKNLAMQCKVSVDTVRRDLEALKSLGSDVQYISSYDISGWLARHPVFVQNLHRMHSTPEQFPSPDDYVMWRF